MRSWMIGLVGAGLCALVPATPSASATTCNAAAQSDDVDLCGQALFTSGPAATRAKMFKDCVIEEMGKKGFTEGKDYTVRVTNDPASELNGPVCKKAKK
ncbi:hypothetical protein [Prosthecomicrobium hirschii]|uniref:hypothetical protein n=1 Tax=Prosthecodimorpha hirschii TaxID=665126 RepID=UPI00221F47C7|nr:hypothetical protein [Prosthecomicrobium hirschii]MCW1843684.1 hypothetical protein [Prosthecomicrobium hirschii]